MNGAIAEPVERTIMTPNNNRTSINGKSQNFFRSLRNDHKSFSISINSF